MGQGGPPSNDWCDSWSQRQKEAAHVTEEAETGVTLLHDPE